MTERRNGFSVCAGAALACQPNGASLHVKLDRRGAERLVDRLQAAGAEHLGEADTALQYQVWLAVPVAKLGSFRTEMAEPHRRFLEEAIEVGRWHPHPLLAAHRPDLRSYILHEASEVDED